MRIMFRDHVIGAEHTLPCYAYGRVARVTKDEVVLDYWAHVDPMCVEREVGRQVEVMTIDRPAIREIVILQPRTATTNQGQ